MTQQPAETREREWCGVWFATAHRQVVCGRYRPSGGCSGALPLADRSSPLSPSSLGAKPCGLTDAHQQRRPGRTNPAIPNRRTR
jgi:hypothetical protein